jgi:hypothetical protein
MIRLFNQQQRARKPRPHDSRFPNPGPLFYFNITIFRTNTRSLTISRLK